MGGKVSGSLSIVGLGEDQWKLGECLLRDSKRKRALAGGGGGLSANEETT